MSKMIHKNKKFKDVEISVMMKTPVWHIERCNVGDDSFQVPAFESDISHLKELTASENNITSVLIVSSQNLHRLDLSMNVIKELKLEPTDYPLME